MKVSLSWLKKHLNTTLTPTELADKLTNIGLEVEEIDDKTAAFQGIIVGEILSKEKHPNADKLNVLRVASGQDVLQIVCGAPNCRVGMKSALALPGTYIAHYGEKLQKGVIRGLESCGMMCSERELNISDNHEGIIDLTTDLPAGTPLADVLKADVVFDVNVTPNRGDCLGIEGIARDLAAAGAGEFIPEKAEPIAGAFSSPVTVSIDDPACAHFVGRYIRGVKNGPSPLWMQEKLLAVGLRPISALVDITNYLNIGLCRPLHVFDADKLTGNLCARSAREGETLAALDEKEYRLAPGMLVIADDAGPQSIAGVMGGTQTGCSPETTNVFLEAAFFAPMSIAKTGRALNAESDSRARFERGVDPLSARRGNDIATRLILDICGGEASDIVEAGAPPACERTIDFDFNEIERLCGVRVERAEAEAILRKLGFTVSGNAVTVPAWRHNDVTGEADLVEEVIRMRGLDDLPESPMRPEKLPTGTLLPHQKRESDVRRALAARGLNQVITWSFMDSRLAQHFDSKKIRLANPIASDLDEMRPSLVPNLLSAVKRNLDRGQKDICFFEVGPEFYSTTPTEQRQVACGIRSGMTGPRHWLQTPRPVDVFDAKADALAALEAMDAPANMQVMTGAPAWYHPGRSGRITLGRNILGYFGEIHPAILKLFDIKTTVVAFEVYPEQVPLKTRKTKAKKALKLSPFMPLTRDFAFVMDETLDGAKLMASIAGVNKELIKQVQIFDVYAGDKLPAGKKSLAVQVTIQPQDKTLTDAEIETLCTQIVNMAAKNCRAELRSV